MPIENRPIPHKSAFKGLQWDYDAVLGASDEECCYSLSEKEILILLATIDPISWLTRWQSPTETLIEQENLIKWQGNLARKLMSGCCGDDVILHRLNDDGEMEISTDGGLTWIPDPADPRLNGTQLPNTIPGTGADKRCNAATNALGNFQDAQAAFGSSLSTATTIAGLALALAGEVIVLLLSAGTAAEILVPLMFSTAAALFGIAESSYNAEFTTEVWDTLVCDLFCTAGSDGQWTESQFIDLQALVDTHFSDNVALTLQSILRGWGTLGLNNAAITGGSSEADCSDCDCGIELQNWPPVDPPAGIVTRVSSGVWDISGTLRDDGTYTAYISAVGDVEWTLANLTLQSGTFAGNDSSLHITGYEISSSNGVLNGLHVPAALNFPEGGTVFWIGWRTGQPFTVRVIVTEP